MRLLISRLQLLRDKVRRQLGIFLFDKPRPAVAIDKANIKHIVFMRTDAKLGDTFVSSFVFDDIKAHDPNIKITVVTTPNMKSLFLDHLGADQVVTLKKRPSYTEITKACIEIGTCDVLVSLNLNPKMKDLFFLKQCKTKHIAGLYDSLKTIDIKLGEKTQTHHFADRFAILLEELGIAAHPRHYMIPKTPESQQTAARFIEVHKLTRFAIINAHGSGSARRLNAASVHRLVEIIQNKDASLPVILLSSPETFQQTEKFISELNIDAIHYDISKSIFDVASLVAKAECVVSVDTAIVHMASGLNIPQLAFYNDDPANFAQWHPNSELALTSTVPVINAVPDINGLDWQDVEQKLAQLIAKTKD
ncbi:glycosyltransferase family 9 protein [Vibrio sp. SCSIO 43140]|uniref:glycosyltransferase family 9 protein n=1 Tax=Vibrio sp. SCSIO 43140 TaxID=2819100 RepID=UPI00207546A6|nr:glycosyltransferase family 9 protein [Vibrio sp. SCSIO 43140]USD60297.1 glycosyltransferase family 9 protein [Vibrio sp. SCSIO 43140]